MAVAKALQFWKNFDIQNLQKQLDDEAALIAKRQDESDASVKKLVDLNKEFKRTASEGVRKAVSPLIKSFQQEIDSLTRRATAAETSFLNCYKKFIEIPDPVGVLEQCVTDQQRFNTLQDVELENTKLRETLDEYNKEFAHVKNQEATITKLKSQIKELENSVDKKANSKLSEIELELKETFGDKEREMGREIMTAKQKMEDALAKSNVLQSALESTQSELFELRNKYDEEMSAKVAELDILSTDLDRSSQRALMAEKELITLRTSYERQQQTLHDTAKATDNVELELEVQAKDKQITQLLQDVERLQHSNMRLKDTSDQQISLLQQQLREKDLSLTSANQKLSEQTDYEEIKKELNIMRSVEFSTHQDSAHSMVTNKSLEVLLLEKNRTLTNENTALKAELSELRGHYTTIQQQLNDSIRTVQDQRTLITGLEADLARIQPFLPPRTEGEGEANPSEPEIIAEVVKDIQLDKQDKKESLLSIVTSQRERFKQRNKQLESESQQQQQTISVLEREVDSLRCDNVKLYEKVRFLQTYPGSRSAGDDPAIHRYSSSYEDSLDPFATFSRKERQRKYAQLSGPDKATLVLGRFILSNKVARLFAFGYTVLLHLIVIMVLVKLSYSVDSQTVNLYEECAKTFAEHMASFHRQPPVIPGAQDGG